MSRTIVFCLAAGLLAPFPASAQSAESPLCEVGISIIDLMYLQSTGANERIAPAALRASIIYLDECPGSVVRAFRKVGTQEPSPVDHVSVLRHAWIEAARSAARHTSNADLRGLLAAAQATVARLRDDSLNQFLDGIFDDAVGSWGVGQRAQERLLRRQALASLRDHTKCDGVGCYDASDNILFLLGTHPMAVLKAMHADSGDATNWLSEVVDESFAGDSERAESREAARRAVLKKLSETQAPGFEPELRACEDRLRQVRYRVVD